MDRDAKPSQVYNLLIFYEDGIRRDIARFVPNVYVLHDDHSKSVYAHTVKKFGRPGRDGLGADSFLEILESTTSFHFSYPGIYIHGIERTPQKDGKRERHRMVMQEWLVTTMSEEELKELDLYGFPKDKK